MAVYLDFSACFIKAVFFAQTTETEASNVYRSINEANSVVTCGDDGKAAHTSNVRNSLGGKIRISARVAVTARA
jgi:hypothetical protein